MKSDILVAKETFTVELDGVDVVVHKGRTRARAGHPIVEGREELWEPIDMMVHYDIEQATAAPGERRGGRGQREMKQEEAGKPAPAAETPKPQATSRA